jgi:hypothetical protein
MKFCKDCKWETHDRFYFCVHPKLGESMIDGTKFNKDARQCREAGRYCGPTAKWFEGKEKPIPKCVDCKWLSGGTSECLKKSVNPRTGFEVYNCTNADFSRRCEQLCDKYGKWWEKKEIPEVTLPKGGSVVGYAQKNLKAGDMVGYTFGGTLLLDTSKIGSKPTKKSAIAKI